MGNGKSSRAPGVPPEVTSTELRQKVKEYRKISLVQINDSLYELYSPTQEPELDIIFFHGLQPPESEYGEAYWRTWFNGEEIWPTTILHNAFPTARMLSVSYDSSARVSATGGRMSLTNIAEALYGDILSLTNVKVGTRPVVLVGHSLGGLVIKKFILFANKQMNGLDPRHHQRDIDATKRFFKRLLGIFYYSTPHGGAVLADVANIKNASPVLLLLRSFDKEANWLNNHFTEWRRNYNKRTYTLFETIPTTFWGFNGVIVDEAAAIQDNDQCRGVAADHFSICKPTNNISASFTSLEDFIRTRREQHVEEADCEDLT